MGHAVVPGGGGGGGGGGCVVGCCGGTAAPEVVPRAIVVAEVPCGQLPSPFTVACEVDPSFLAGLPPWLW